MTDDLMNAILAMNAYDFGSHAALDGAASTGLGSWTRTTYQDIESNDFGAVTYSNGSKYEIAYRGTTTVFGSNFFDGDLWNGWTIGGGTDEAADVNAAIAYYQNLLATVTANGGSSADITLTGHSLGGGLAGLVGTIYGVKGYLFDNMPFELAAANALTDSTPGSAYNPNLASFIYGSATPPANDESKLAAYATGGEPLSLLRWAGPQTLPVTNLNSGATSVLGTIQLHSMALDALLLYAHDNNLTGWSSIMPYWMPELWNDDVAAAAGVGKAGTAGTEAHQHSPR